jgi:hypothetical protein
MTAWPGGPFKHLTVLRRRRNELEYPAFPGEHIEIAEVKSAIDTAARWSAQPKSTPNTSTCTPDLRKPPRLGRACQSA